MIKRVPLAEPKTVPTCRHGNRYYCGFCLSEKEDGRVVVDEMAAIDSVFLRSIGILLEEETKS